MLTRIIMAIVVGVFVILVCILLGDLLVSFDISWVLAIGSFLKQFANLIGLLAALWTFVVGNFA